MGGGGCSAKSPWFVAWRSWPQQRCTTPAALRRYISWRWAIRLTAGYGLADKDGFVPRLQAALAKNGIDADIANAGVSGDTAADGLARLDWSVPQGTDAVIVELGANDMLRGIKPEVTRAALDAILQRLTARHISVLLCGMRAAPNLGADYGQAFDADLSRTGGKIRRSALPVLSRRCRRRSQSHPARRHASESDGRRRDRRAYLAEG